MKCYLVINPRSRGGKACRQFSRLFLLLEEADIGFDYCYASSYEGMRNASVFAQERAYDAIVAVGGDGTINAVLNGFFDEAGKLRSDKKFGVIYTGTSPDFCKSYMVPRTLEACIRAISAGQVRPLKTGLVKFSNGNGNSLSRHFACCASVGIGAMVASRSNRIRKYLGDFPGTLAAILSALISFRPCNLTLLSGGTLREFNKVTNVFVGRTRYIASGIKACQEISHDDPRYYVIMVKDLRPGNLLQLFRQIYSGDFRSSSVTELLFTEKVTLIPRNGDVELEFDGDPVGYAPCSFQPSGSLLSLIYSPSLATDAG